jgi:hypothetical protein
LGMLSIVCIVRVQGNISFQVTEEDHILWDVSKKTWFSTVPFLGQACHSNNI